MRSYLHTSFFLLLVLSPYSLYATATNPVSWTVTPSTGFSATPVGNQSTVKYTLTNHLPFSTVFTMSEKITGGNFTVRDKCHGVSVAPNGSCDIYVGFNPADAGTSTYQLIYGYHKNRIPTTIFSVNSEHPSAVLTGTFTGLPASIEENDTPDFTITYLNKSNVEVTSCTNGGTPITLSGAAAATATLASIVDNCNGNTILPGHSCTVTGRIVNTSTNGALSVAGHLLCTAGSSSIQANPLAQTDIISSASCTIHGYTSLPLPTSTFKYADNIVQFTFENECSTAQPLSTNVTVNDPYSVVTLSTSSTLTTCGSTLAANSDCLLTANIRAMDTGSLIVTGSATSGSQTARAVTESSVNLSTYTNHRVTFVNQCNQPIWIGIVNAGTNKIDPLSPGTPNDYLLPKQTSGARPSFKTVTFPVEYIGGFWGRTGCSTTSGSFVCDTGNCPTSGITSGTCSGASPLAPYTGIEMNFFTSAQSDGSYDGVYDITMIGGVNVPVMMKGFGPGKVVTPGYNNTPFACNSAGSSVQRETGTNATGLGSCPWTFTVPGLNPNRMPTKAFYFVKDEGTPTTYNLNTSDNCGCASDKLCGLAMGIGGADNNIYYPACGDFLGYLTINSLCSSVFDLTHVSGASDPKSYYHCATSLNTQFSTTRYLPSNTVADLYSCTFNSSNPGYLNSCYLDSTNPGYNNKCCGSYEWTNTRLDDYTAMSNPDWANTTSNLIPSPFNSINWLEAGCPTAYSYPFGDHFGSFYCKESPNGNYVKMEYEVVYCPGGTSISSDSI